MSDLQKSFLKRLKQREASLGLSSLSEDPIESTGLNNQTSRDEIINQDKKIVNQYNTVKSNFENFIYKDDNRYFKCYYRPVKEKGPVLVCLHGAGSSSMTFARLTEHIEFSVFLFDMRGHGESFFDEDFSMNSLVDDVRFVLNEFVESYKPSSIFMLGHSLGGAVFANYLQKYQTEKLYQGLILLDIVEETAVSSLIVMPQFIEKIPKKFDSLTSAIQWHMNFLLFNENSAEVSVPDLLNLDELTWKTDLKRTQYYWDTWFHGLSKNFLNFKGAKLLILSAHETLDKELIIGQMQGKYQLVVFNNNQKSGHFVHEDIPKQVAICINDFIKKTIAPEKYMKEDLGFKPKWGGKINS
ncbi:PPE1 [Candida pseudojiufengensis]|uniref:PPE1 n=1 Tax=Candida pseudojiufengensis TaxID=497109 RepID=UPI00222441C4|nr:PPE1 [Candida pseudojiufengensis]KAI5960675.1 PPE1 [Candida pseudojiufengensis]